MKTQARGARRSATAQNDEPTISAQVAEGRGLTLDPGAARRMAIASLRAGFPIPPRAAQVLGDEGVEAATEAAMIPAEVSEEPSEQPGGQVATTPPTDPNAGQADQRVGALVKTTES